MLNPEKKRDIYPKVILHPMVGDCVDTYDAVCYSNHIKLGGLEH